MLLLDEPDTLDTVRRTSHLLLLSPGAAASTGLARVNALGEGVVAADPLSGWLAKESTLRVFAAAVAPTGTRLPS